MRPPPARLPAPAPRGRAESLQRGAAGAGGGPYTQRLAQASQQGLASHPGDRANWRALACCTFPYSPHSEGGRDVQAGILAPWKERGGKTPFDSRGRGFQPNSSLPAPFPQLVCSPLGALLGHFCPAPRSCLVLSSANPYPPGDVKPGGPDSEPLGKGFL